MIPPVNPSAPATTTRLHLRFLASGPPGLAGGQFGVKVGCIIKTKPDRLIKLDDEIRHTIGRLGVQIIVASPCRAKGSSLPSAAEDFA
jgi:hypothetical protein